MVISGTHALDIVMWMMEAKRPVEIYARSVDKALGPICRGIDATAGMITFEDGSLYHASISWALADRLARRRLQPRSRHRRHRGRAHHRRHAPRHRARDDASPSREGYAPDASRRVDFLGSYPPGDIALGELRGPMREETEQWLNRVSMGLPDAARDGGRGAQPADADQGLRPFGEAQEAGRRCRSRRKTKRPDDHGDRPLAVQNPMQTPGDQMRRKSHDTRSATLAASHVLSSCGSDACGRIGPRRRRQRPPIRRSRCA